MLLRRISQHVKDQNWIAIVLDFLIVVLGVFIGIQLGNWNEALSEKKSLRAALSNLEIESQINLDIIDAMVEKIDAALVEVEEGRIVLEACTDNDMSRQSVSEAINALAGDFEPTFTIAAMTTLANREAYVSKLSPALRSWFNQYLGRLSEEQDQLKTNFLLAWQDHVILDPMLDGNLSQPIEAAYSENASPVIILNSVADLCNLPSFRRRYQVTSGFVYVISLRLKNLRGDVEKFRSVLIDEI